MRMSIPSESMLDEIIPTPLSNLKINGEDVTDTENNDRTLWGQR